MPADRKSPGLRQRLIVALAVPLIIILGVSSVFDYRMARSMSDAASDQGLADAVFDLETHIRNHGLTSRLDLNEESEAMLRSNAPDAIYFSIRDAAGQVLAGDQDIPVFALPAGGKLSFFDASYHDTAMRAAVHRVSIEDTEISITVMETTRKRQRAQREILSGLLLPNLAVIIASLLTVLFGVRRGLLPLGAVEREIAARSPHDLREIDLASSPHEIHPMLRRLNQLFVQLREAAEAQNRFIADAAHQLRTPLAGLQTQIDLAVSEGSFSKNEGRLQSIEQGTAQIGRLLGQLLSYARAEASGSLPGKPERVALEQIVERSASTFFDAALAKDVDLGFDISPVVVTGLQWLLAEALANLIDNAIRYTPPGGCITVRCGKADGKAFLEVEDNGPGIPEVHRQDVFQRFYRIPGSPSNGCGLGLPIVREIAELHGTEVMLISAQPSGLRARLEFPLPAND